MLPGQMSTWLLESVQDVPRNLSLKFHHNQVLRYSLYGQMSRGQKLPGQMLPLQLESVLDVHRNLHLKLHQLLILSFFCEARLCSRNHCCGVSSRSRRLVLWLVLCKFKKANLWDMVLHSFSIKTVFKEMSLNLRLSMPKFILFVVCKLS